MRFNEIKNNLKKDVSNLKKIRISLLGDSATQLLHQALKGYGIELGFNLEIFEADIDQIERQILYPESELYQQESEFIIIFPSVFKLLKQFYSLDNNQKGELAYNFIIKIESYYQALLSKNNYKVILFNFPEINDSIYGNYANKTETSFLFQVRKINFELMKLSQNLKNLYINDASLLFANTKRFQAIDYKIYYLTDSIFSLDFLPLIAKNTLDVIQSISGKFNKCLILDLDNTLWGGIIGDDGLENIQIGNLGIGKIFSDIQLWAKQLKERGIIIAICSKNNEAIAKEPFLKHPDMKLSLDDIALFVANWNNKVDNIHYIQQVLNIGFDSMVFIDDNPFERNMVRLAIPQLLIPELPEDPSDYLPYLRSLNLFETASLSDNDKERTKQYQEQSKRIEHQKQFKNEADFLLSLEMQCRCSPFDSFNIPRISQLSQRSNQFNLRTKRYTEEDVKFLSNSTNHFTFYFELRDKYGDHGLISVIVLEKKEESLFIENWMMSCRVLKRGMESFALNKLVEIARDNNFNILIGEYIPSSKNEIVENHYSQLGFKKINGYWILNVSDYVPMNNYITFSNN